MSINTIYSTDFLNSVMEMPIRENYVKLEILDWNENFIEEI
jgi:hypothetical protein